MHTRVKTYKCMRTRVCVCVCVCVCVRVWAQASVRAYVGVCTCVHVRTQWVFFLLSDTYVLHFYGLGAYLFLFFTGTLLRCACSVLQMV